MKELVNLHFGMHRLNNFYEIVGKNKTFKAAIGRLWSQKFWFVFQTDPKKAENFDNQFKTMTLRLSYSEQSVLDQMQGDEFEGFDFVNDNFYQYRNSAFIPQYS